MMITQFEAKSELESLLTDEMKPQFSSVRQYSMPPQFYGDQYKSDILDLLYEITGHLDISSGLDVLLYQCDCVEERYLHEMGIKHESAT